MVVTMPAVKPAIVSMREEGSWERLLIAEFGYCTPYKFTL